MKVFCSSGSAAAEGAIFQCPMMPKFGLSSEGTSESSVLHRRGYSLTTTFNGLSIPTVNFNKDFTNCNNNNNIANNYNNNNEECPKHDPVKETNTKLLSTDKKNEACPAQAPQRMKELMEGLNEHGDSQNPPEVPSWLDRERFNQGRKFYEKYLFCIFFSDLLSLLMMFSVTRLLRPLIFTDRSDTPLRALRRYVSTIMHVITWFTGDLWNPNDRAHKDILKVRAIHNKSSDIMNSSKNYEKMKNVSVLDKGHEPPSCPFSSAIRHDLQKQAKPGLQLESDDVTTFYISQWDMLVTQYSFLGLILAHPQRMGAWYVTEKELDGLVHFWRGIGWLLGIKDKYNFCSGTLAETLALCAEMEKLVMIPELAKSDWSHEHMAESLIQGTNNMVPCLNFPAMFRFLADTLGLSVPSFIQQMSYPQTFRYWLMCFIFHIAFLIPGVISLFNWLLRVALRLVQIQCPSWFPQSMRPPTVSEYDYS